MVASLEPRPEELQNAAGQSQNVALYPLMLTPAFFAKRQALVVGGGKVAERKIKALLIAGAKVRVIAPHLTKELRRLAETALLEWLPREWQPGDIATCRNALLIFAATDNFEVNQAVAQEAHAENRLVNLADDPAGCDFTLPGVVRSDEITVAVTSYSPSQESEASPALTAHLRRQLEQFIGPEYSELVRLLRQLRPDVKARVAPTQRSNLWRQMVESSALNLLKENRYEEAQELLNNLLEQVVSQPFDEDFNLDG